jgi:hypothetical protein
MLSNDGGKYLVGSPLPLFPTAWTFPSLASLLHSLPQPPFPLLKFTPFSCRGCKKSSQMRRFLKNPSDYQRLKVPTSFERFCAEMTGTIRTVQTTPAQNRAKVRKCVPRKGLFGAR